MKYLAADMRYFFDLVDGDTKIDLSGAEFENDAGARQEATLRALSHNRSFRLQQYDGFGVIRVRDETDRTVCEVPIER